MSIKAENQWRVVSVSVAGRSHEKRGQPCQDKHHWQILQEGILVAAVADGAGSSNLGDVGAQIAVNVALGAISQQKLLPVDDIGWQFLLVDALRAAKNAVLAESQVREVDPRELATTLILVVATPGFVLAQNHSAHWPGQSPGYADVCPSRAEPSPDGQERHARISAHRFPARSRPDG